MSTVASHPAAVEPPGAPRRIAEPGGGFDDERTAARVSTRLPGGEHTSAHDLA